jgi:hypothetical protein
VEQSSVKSPHRFGGCSAVARQFGCDRIVDEPSRASTIRSSKISSSANPDRYHPKGRVNTLLPSALGAQRDVVFRVRKSTTRVVPTEVRKYGTQD